MPERPFAQKSTAKSRRDAERRAAALRAEYEAAVKQHSVLNKPKLSQMGNQPQQQQQAVNSPNQRPSNPQNQANSNRSLNGFQASNENPLNVSKNPTLVKKTDKVSKKRKKVKVRKEVQKKTPNATFKLAGYTFAALIVILLTILYGAPILGRELNWTILASGGIITLVLLERTISWLPKTRKRPKFLIIIASLLILTFFGLGISNQIVINGKAYTSWSPTAKAYSLSTDVYADLLTLRENDRYLDLPSEQARTYSNEIKIAVTTSAGIANKWNPAVVRELPSDSFLTVMREVNAAADAQAQALDLLSQDLLQPDVARQSNILTKRAASIDSITTAVSSLRESTAPFGFDPIVSEGPVE